MAMLLLVDNRGAEPADAMLDERACITDQPLRRRTVFAFIAVLFVLAAARFAVVDSATQMGSCVPATAQQRALSHPCTGAPPVTVVHQLLP